MRRFKRILGFSLPLCLVACGPAGDADSLPGATYIGSQRFGAEERSAAVSLSVGAVPSLTDNDDTYRQAILCSISLQTLVERLVEADVLDARGMAELRRAQARFDDEVERLGSAEGRARAQIAQDKDAEAALVDIGARAQIGIGCLRRLATSL